MSARLPTSEVVRLAEIARAHDRVPFSSDADLEAALDEAHVSSRASDDALDAYRPARIDGLEAALAILAVLAVAALFLAQRIPTRQPGAPET